MTSSSTLYLPTQKCRKSVAGRTFGHDCLLPIFRQILVDFPEAKEKEMKEKEEDLSTLSRRVILMEDEVGS